MMEWFPADDIRNEIIFLLQKLGFSHIDPARIFCFRSTGSKSKARARIWSLPRIWQKALAVPPGYCIEIIAERFDHLPAEDKKKILIHELLHIPRNFSGSLLSHRGKYHSINTKVVEILWQKIQC
ncbi:metallopeptidase [Candidatus Shapirobacteria bacterium]|nr:metallopeptidase [Candidatus Shapirobacteria bacterium]